MSVIHGWCLQQECVSNSVSLLIQKPQLRRFLYFNTTNTANIEPHIKPFLNELKQKHLIQGFWRLGFRLKAAASLYYTAGSTISKGHRIIYQKYESQNLFSLFKVNSLLSRVDSSLSVFSWVSLIHEISLLLSLATSTWTSVIFWI